MSGYAAEKNAKWEQIDFTVIRFQKLKFEFTTGRFPCRSLNEQLIRAQYVLYMCGFVLTMVRRTLVQGYAGMVRMPSEYVPSFRIQSTLSPASLVLQYFHNDLPQGYEFLNVVERGGHFV